MYVMDRMCGPYRYCYFIFGTFYEPFLKNSAKTLHALSYPLKLDLFNSRPELSDSVDPTYDQAH